MLPENQGVRKTKTESDEFLNKETPQNFARLKICHTKTTDCIVTIVKAN